MIRLMTVSDISCEMERRFGVLVPPKAISDILYQRKVDTRSCPIIAGRRLIPPELMPAIVSALRDRGLKIPDDQEF